MTQLVRYEAMRVALADCVRLDEVQEIVVKADQLAAYAALMNDVMAEVDAREIRARAARRFGELSSELETAELAGRGTVSLPSVGKTKEQQLAEVGVSTSTAHRYEELTGRERGEAGVKVADAAAEAYYAQSREDGKPASLGGLKAAIREALVEEFGEPPEREKVVSFRGKPDPMADALTDLGGAIKVLAELPEADATALAARVQPELLDWHLDHGTRAHWRLDTFLTALEGRKQNAA